MYGVGMGARGDRNIRIRKWWCGILILLVIGILNFGCGDAAQEAMTELPAETDMAQEALTDRSAEADAAQEATTDRLNDVNAATEEQAGQPQKSISDHELSDENDGGEDSDEVQQIPRPAPVKVKGIYVSGPVAGIDKMDELINLVESTELNAMVIDVKNDEGKVTYKMQSPQVQELETSIRYIPDIEALVEKCKEKHIYLIARIVAFRDPYLAEKKPEWALHTKGGEIFRDQNGMAWINPYEREVWDYLVEVALQAAADGFDEVQFDYIRFSTDLGAEEVDYGPQAAETDKVEIITQFTDYLYEKLAPRGVYVAADVFGTVIDNKTDQKIVGQEYTAMAQHLDYICPMVYPSHYHNGAYGLEVPDADPYATVYAAASSSARELEAVPEEKRAHVRLWLQSFTAGWIRGHISYGPQQIREQIRGVYDAGYEEWILWNAAVNYQPEALLSAEAAAGADAGAQTEADSGADAGTETEADSGADIEEQAGADTQAGTDAEAVDVEADTAVDTETRADTQPPEMDVEFPAQQNE